MARNACQRNSDSQSARTTAAQFQLTRLLSLQLLAPRKIFGSHEVPERYFPKFTSKSSVKCVIKDPMSYERGRCIHVGARCLTTTAERLRPIFSTTYV